ncbi:MAG: SH3 domain-containing protein [Eubacteriales bacterium]|nr:SH3 domain-containing protein [Eubacteriales bacterium]
MKRYTAVLLTGILLLTLLAPCVALAADREFGQVTAEGVNLRDQPNTDAAILEALPLNTEVEVLEEQDGWYRVLYGGVVGYLRQDYVFVNSTGSRAAYVLEDGVKLRGGPGASSYVVAELSASQGVKVRRMVGEWYFIVAGDDVGYVQRNYLMMTKATNTASNLLRSGMEGQEVKRMQEKLYDRGFLAKADITGLYGGKTRKAVADFQEACGFAEDGVAGGETLAALYDINNKVTKANALATQVKGSVQLLDWFEGGSDWLAKGSKFVVIDVRTGLQFNARRFGGWYHADSEPISASDTAIMKQIAGGSWSWNRRPIWVSYRGRVVAASMHCMPHMDNPTKSNNFPGHFCIHLLNSKVHETSKACPRHQACVQEAYRKGK